MLVKTSYKFCLLFRFAILSFSLQLLSTSVIAQSKKEILKKAEAYFDSSNFQEALPLYLKLHKTDTNNSIYNYAIGFCYFNSPKGKIKSIPFYEKVAKNKKSPLYKYVGFNLGQSYAKAYRFEEAGTVLEKYQKTVSKLSGEYKEITDQIKFYKYAQFLVNSPVNYPIKNMGVDINSIYPDYSPVISADGTVLIFTTRRPTGRSGFEKEEDGQFYEDIFITNKKEDGSWTDPVGISNNINTMSHDASVGLSADGQQLFVYKDDYGDGNIYVCALNGNEWSTPKKLNSNINSDAFEPSACLSADGNTLYFVSDRKGGFGSTDIYKSKKLPDGEWGLPMNLGPQINTDKEEDTPFIQADEKGLYFSSQGRMGLGGYDIFYSAMGEDGNWSTAKNIGYPINTTDDDLFYVLSGNGKYAYYASSKEEGVGDKDIYQVTLPTTLNIALIKGRIRIDDSDTAIIKSTIEVSNKSNGELIGIYKPNSKTGKYVIILNQDNDYSFNIYTDGFEPYAKDFSIPASNDYAELNQEFHFYHKEANQQEVVFNDSFTTQIKSIAAFIDSTPPQAVKETGTIKTNSKEINIDTVFNNILFSVNKKTLNRESIAILNKVCIFMQENPASNLNIEGHTDRTGSASYNLKLSKERAKVCKNYLTGKGINEKRINSKGYGEMQPEFTNSTPEGRKKNRRVKLLIL